VPVFAFGNSGAQGSEALLRHLPHALILVVLDDALEQIHVLAFQAGPDHVIFCLHKLAYPPRAVKARGSAGDGDRRGVSP
jgi:hypothetical protein